MNPPPRFQRPLGPPKRNARQRVLAEWRRVDTREEEGARKSAEKPAGAIVEKVLKDIRMDRRRAEAEIVNVWNSIVDPETARHAQPAGIAKGTLFVDVDSPVWLSEIVRYRRKEILERLQASFGRQMIAKISFRAKG